MAVLQPINGVTHLVNRLLHRPEEEELPVRGLPIKLGSEPMKGD